MFLQRCRRSCFSNNSALLTLGEMCHGPQPCACLLPALLPLLPVLLLRNPLYIWAAAIQSELQQIGVPDHSFCGIAPNAPRTIMHRWLQHAKTVICSHAHAQFQAVGQDTHSLLQYLFWQPTSQLHPIAYEQHTCQSQVARCGHHDFSDGRPVRHGHTDPLAPCHSCAVGIDSLEHALLNCSAHQAARPRCMQQSGSSAPLLLHRLFSTNPCINSTRDISRNIACVPHVCQAAAACEW